MICIDNSEWMRNGDYAPNRFQSQAEAVNLICGAKTQVFFFQISVIYSLFVIFFFSFQLSLLSNFWLVFLLFSLILTIFSIYLVFLPRFFCSLLFWLPPLAHFFGYFFFHFVLLLLRFVVVLFCLSSLSTLLFCSRILKIQ